VVIVTAILGVTLFLLLVFILSLLSRINLLSRQIDSIEKVLGESDEKLREVAKLIIGLPSSGAMPGSPKPPR
jgi:hypothetical protein